MSMNFTKTVVDSDWGCEHQELVNFPPNTNIKILFVEVTSLTVFATQLTNFVLDSSWMTDLDKGTQRAYETTVNETAEALAKIFKETSAAGTIGAEFGEVMVSIGSARALEKILFHVKVPIAELWKPQVKQNEGFDFHTVCTGNLINFGEAKYSGNSTPHGLAITQADDFIGAKKHLRDRVHLINLVDKMAIDQLDDDQFGVVAAFSLNVQKPLLAFENAIKSAEKVVDKNKLKFFYLVGVRDEC